MSTDSKILFSFLVLVFGLFLIDNAHADDGDITYCNKSGSTTTCQEFKNNGSENIQYYNQSGDTTTEQEFQVQDPTN